MGAGECRTREGGGAEDVVIGDEGLVLVAGKGGIPRKDVQMVHVAVAVDEDDAPAVWEGLGEEAGRACAAVAGPEDGDGLGVPGPSPV